MDFFLNLDYRYAVIERGQRGGQDNGGVVREFGDKSSMRTGIAEEESFAGVDDARVHVPGSDVDENVAQFVRTSNVGLFFYCTTLVLCKIGFLSRNCYF